MGSDAPRRLLHVFPTFAPGGSQVRTTQLMAALGNGFAHSVCALDGCFDAFELLDPALGVQRVAAPPRAGTLTAVRRLRALLSEVGPDLLLTYNWGSIEAVLAGRTLGLAMVHHEDGFLPDEAQAFKRRRIWMRRLALPFTRGVIVPSHRLLDIATELWRLRPAGPGDRGQVELIPNGLRVETFPLRDGNPQLRGTLGIPEDAFVVGSVGHLRREKNPVRLVEALAAMETPGTHVLLLGDGPERGAVEDAARAAGVAARLHAVGHVADPRDHYRAMDAFAIPSDTEQMPVALLEAMAAGLPAAGTDVGDVARMLVQPEPEHGPLVVPTDARALAAALDRLAADPALRARLGAEGRRRVEERYSFATMREAYRRRYGAAMAS